MTVYSGEEEREARRWLTVKVEPFAWEVLNLEHHPQVAEAVGLELHRAFAGAIGEYHAGPVVPTCEERYAALLAETSRRKQAELTHRLTNLSTTKQ